MPVSVPVNLCATATLVPAAIKLACDSKTPFGTPVVPDVYINKPMVSADGSIKSAGLTGMISVSAQRGPASTSIDMTRGACSPVSISAAIASSTNARLSSAHKITSVFEWLNTKASVLTPATRFSGVARNPPYTTPRKAKLAAAPFGAAIATDAPAVIPAPCK